ncbi:hypothetical protein O988_02084 [Pseudogymnoascus sp. VKM F-3808]|nr:hypothetical protein O988_02084 [Pseudogymnoascus sp. VKM F-3808]
MKATTRLRLRLPRAISLPALRTKTRASMVWPLKIPSPPSSLLGPSTPPDSDYLGADCFSKNGQQPLPFAELDLAYPVQIRRPSRSCSELADTTGQDQIHQGVEKAIVGEMRPTRCNPRRERAGGSCDGDSVCDIENELRYTSEEVEGSPVSTAIHSQCNQINQESTAGRMWDNRR